MHVLKTLQKATAFETSQVIEFGLSDKAGDYTLNIGKSYGCTSILNDYDVARLTACGLR